MTPVNIIMNTLYITPLCVLFTALTRASNFGDVLMGEDDPSLEHYVLNDYLGYLSSKSVEQLRLLHSQITPTVVSSSQDFSDFANHPMSFRQPSFNTVADIRQATDRLLNLRFQPTFAADFAHSVLLTYVPNVYRLWDKLGYAVPARVIVKTSDCELSKQERRQLLINLQAYLERPTVVIALSGPSASTHDAAWLGMPLSDLRDFVNVAYLFNWMPSMRHGGLGPVLKKRASVLLRSHGVYLSVPTPGDFQVGDFAGFASLQGSMGKAAVDLAASLWVMLAADSATAIEAIAAMNDGEKIAVPIRSNNDRLSVAVLTCKRSLVCGDMDVELEDEQGGETQSWEVILCCSELGRPFAQMAGKCVQLQGRIKRLLTPQTYEELTNPASADSLLHTLSTLLSVPTGSPVCASPQYSSLSSTAPSSSPSLSSSSSSSLTSSLSSSSKLTCASNGGSSVLTVAKTLQIFRAATSIKADGDALSRIRLLCLMGAVVNAEYDVPVPFMAPTMFGQLLVRSFLESLQTTPASMAALVERMLRMPSGWVLHLLLGLSADLRECVVVPARHMLLSWPAGRAASMPTTWAWNLTCYLTTSCAAQ